MLDCIRHFDKTVFRDTFTPLVCAVLGHKVSIRDFWEDRGDAMYCCKRCCRYLRNYQPQIEGLSVGDTKMVKWVEEELGREVTILNIEGGGYKLSWQVRPSDTLYKDWLEKSGSFCSDTAFPNIKRGVANYLRWRLASFSSSGSLHSMVVRGENDPKAEEYKKEWREKNGYDKLSTRNNILVGGYDTLINMDNEERGKDEVLKDMKRKLRDEQFLKLLKGVDHKTGLVSDSFVVEESKNADDAAGENCLMG